MPFPQNTRNLAYERSGDTYPSRIQPLTDNGVKKVTGIGPSVDAG